MKRKKDIHTTSLQRGRDNEEAKEINIKTKIKLYFFFPKLYTDIATSYNNPIWENAA